METTTKDDLISKIIDGASDLDPQDKVYLIKRLTAVKAAAKKESKRMRGGYYKESEAQRVKEIIDAAFFASDYDPEDPPVVFFDKNDVTNLNTLRLQLMQGYAYLREHMDTPDYKYSRLWDRIQIKVCDDGVRIVESKTKRISVTMGKILRQSQDRPYKVHRNDDVRRPLVDTIIDPVTGNLIKPSTWEEELSNFVSNSRPGEQFIRTDLKVTNEQGAKWTEIFENSSHIAGAVTKSEVKAINIKQEDETLDQIAPVGD